MRAWEQVAYFEIRTVQIIFLSQAVCGRAHIVKGADEIGQNRLIRPLVAFKILSIFSCAAALSAAMCLRTARFARDRLACGMDLHVVRFARAASGLNFGLNR